MPAPGLLLLHSRDEFPKGGDVRAQRLAPLGGQGDPCRAMAQVDALAAFDIVDCHEGGHVFGQDRVADVKAVAQGRELRLRYGGKHRHELEARRGLDAGIETGHQRPNTKSTSPATARTPKTATHAADSPRPCDTGSPWYRRHQRRPLKAYAAPPATAHEATSHQIPSKPAQSEAPKATTYEMDAAAPFPHTTRLASPPSHTPLSCRNRVSWMAPTSTKRARPPAKTARAHARSSARWSPCRLLRGMPKAVVAIWTATAAPIAA